MVGRLEKMRNDFYSTLNGANTVKPTIDIFRNGEVK